MKKKIIVALGIGIVVVVGAGTVYATRSQKAKSSSDQAYELGQMIQEQDKETDTSDELYAVGKDIQITKQEMKNHEKRFALGEEDAQDSVTDDGKSSEEKAFQALVRRKTLAVAAETAGYTVSDAELDQIVSAKREAMDAGIDDPENKEYGETLKALYDSFGGEDQYWEYMREETRTSAEIEKYFADKEKEYKEQLGSDGETAQTWDEAREELVAMHKTTTAICDWLEAHPESQPKTRRFAEYYIPTTLKLLHTYNDVQGQQGENAETIRRDIAGILHTLNQAYENLYNNLLSDVAMDISSEIAALQGMLANDGLTGREFE